MGIWKTVLELSLHIYSKCPTQLLQSSKNMLVPNLQASENSMKKIAGKSKLLTWCPTKFCSRTSVGSRKNSWFWQNWVHISNTTQLLELNSIPLQHACFSIHHGPSCICHGPSHLHQFGYLHCSWCIRFGDSTSREWNKVTPHIRGRATY